MTQKNLWIATTAAAILLLAAYGFLQVTSRYTDNLNKNVDPEIGLTLVLLFGMVTLFSVITLVIVVFAALKLSDPREAMGLPRGSIRAIIALLLLIMFGIISMFLFRQVMAVDQAAGTKFAEQVLTTVSTLVVSLASFYFGAKAVEGVSNMNQRGDSEPGMDLSGATSPKAPLPDSPLSSSSPSTIEETAQPTVFGSSTLASTQDPSIPRGLEGVKERLVKRGSKLDTQS
jgi:hypothetical protein